MRKRQVELECKQQQTNVKEVWSEMRTITGYKTDWTGHGGRDVEEC